MNEFYKINNIAFGIFKLIITSVPKTRFLTLSCKAEYEQLFVEFTLKKTNFVKNVTETLIGLIF